MTDTRLRVPGLANRIRDKVEKKVNHPWAKSEERIDPQAISDDLIYSQAPEALLIWADEAKPMNSADWWQWQEYHDRLNKVMKDDDGKAWVSNVIKAVRGEKAVSTAHILGRKEADDA